MVMKNPAYGTIIKCEGIVKAMLEIIIIFLAVM